MNKFFLIFLIFLLSCGYEDIDSVPNFKNMVINEQESIDLCNMSKSDNEAIAQCLKNISNSKNN